MSKPSPTYKVDQLIETQERLIQWCKNTKKSLFEEVNTLSSNHAETQELLVKVRRLNQQILNAEEKLEELRAIRLNT